MIRPAIPADAEGWGALRTALWPEGSAEDHAVDIARYFWSGDDDVACLMADGPHGLVGFAELSVRTYAEGVQLRRAASTRAGSKLPSLRRGAA